jgi:uncharacterized protein YcbK (DUF882 family)
MFANNNPDDALQFKVSQLGDGYRLSRNFKLSEAKSQCGSDTVYVHPAVLVLAQKIRDEFGPIRVNSWYRSPEHNATITGSSKQSRHMLGMAIDIVPLRATLNDVRLYAETLNVGGMGTYETFVHLDVDGIHRRWHG